MKFTIAKESILPLLQYAVNFTASKNLNVILQNLLIEAKDNRLYLRSTTFQTGFSCSLDAEIAEAGITTVNAKKLSDIIKETPDNADIDFQFDGAQLHLYSGNSKFYLQTMDPSYFPVSPTITPEYSFSVEGKLFVALLKRIAFCVSNDTLKVEYNGAHLGVFGNTIELSSADYQRAATASTSFENSIIDEFIINIPKKTVLDIIKIFDNAEKIEVETDRRQISFSTKNITVTSNLIEKYIKSLSRLFQAEYKLKAQLNREEITGVVKRIAPMASELTNGLQFSFQGSQLTVSSLESEYGKGVATIDGIIYEGEAIDIVFNAKHLLEILQNITSAAVIFEMNSEKQPVLILPDNGEAKYLLVPISIEKI